VIEDDFLMELHTDWNMQGNPEVHRYLTELQRSLVTFPDHYFYNNLMGAVLFVKQDWLAAARYFEVAVQGSSFQTNGILQNYIRAQTMVNGTETLRFLLAELHNDIYNTVLLDEFAATLHSMVSLNIVSISKILTLVLELPQVHEMWLVLVDYVLHHRVIDEVSVEELGLMATYGLSLFPRSSELHLLRAELYHREGTHACATQLLDSAEQIALATISGTGLSHSYADVVRQLREQSQDNPDDPESISACAPNLHRHSTAHYQTIYKQISQLLGAGWENISSHRNFPVQYRHRRALIETSVLQKTAFLPLPESLYYPSLQVGCSRSLRCTMPGFMIADALASPSTHYVTLAYDLSMVESGSVGLLYSSHVLEHLSHNVPPVACASYPRSSHRQGRGHEGEGGGNSSSGDGGGGDFDRSCLSEVDAALAEWRRVLVPDGTLLLSVPDLTKLAYYFTRPGVLPFERAALRMIVYGGQIDIYDAHKSGYDFEHVHDLLIAHGFCNITEVPEFGMFLDTSSTTFYANESISVNVRAVACTIPMASPVLELT
jgi:predicted SAM-dependent methyltransferase